MPNSWPGSWDKNNPIKNKFNVEGRETAITYYKKNWLDLTEVKISKPATLVLRPGYLNKKQIKTV
jgi:hypothetical protein